MDYERETTELRARAKWGHVPDDRPSPCLILDPKQYNSKKKTVVVLGLIRGGTSAVAAILHALGIDFGVGWSNHEERERGIVFADKPTKAMGLISKLNAKHNAWGLKVPRLVDSWGAANLHKALRNPYYVIVTRDVTAITSTHLGMTDEPNSPSSTFWKQCLIQANFRSWVAGLPKAPKIAVSYERLLSQTGRTVEQLAKFIDVDLDDRTKLLAMSVVNPDGGYLITPQDELKSWITSRLQ